MARRRIQTIERPGAVVPSGITPSELDARVPDPSGASEAQVLSISSGVPDWVDPPAGGGSDARIYVDDYIDEGDRGTTDNSAAIQSAFNAADALVATALGGGGQTAYPTVEFGPGDYRLDSAITWKRHNIIGAGSYHGTRLQWNGTATIPIVRNGQLRFQHMTGLALNVMGATRPTYWLDIQGPVDFGGKLQDIQFGATTAGGIQMGGWFNLHWRDLRWDAIGGYAIDATIPAGQYKSSFLLDGFTYDHQAEEAGNGEGVIQLTIDPDNADIGRVRIANGRIEPNGEWAGTKSVVHINHGATTYDNVVGLHLSDLDIQDSSGAVDSVLVYRTGSSSRLDSFMLTNVGQSGLSSLTGGTWYGSDPALPMRSFYPFLSYGAPMGADIHRLNLYANDVSWDNFLYARRGEEAYDRWQVDHTAGFHFGGGAAAPDTRLYRNAANSLAMGAGDNFAVDGTWNGGTLWMGNYALWVDSTGDLRIKNGAPASDTDGTVVGTQS